MGVIIGADLTKDLYKIGTKDSILNSLYTRNQFTTCAEGTVNISDVPSINVLLRECTGKASQFGELGYKKCNCKISCRNNFCSCRKSDKLCNSKCYNSLSAKTNYIRVGIHHDVLFFCFSFLTNWCNKKYILVLFSKEKNFSLQLNSYLSLFLPFITIYFPTEVGNYTYFLKESSY